MFKHILFAAAILAQVAILAAKPAEKLRIRHVTGRQIVLRTEPVDPYDVMRGYYMTLSYEIARPPGREVLDDVRPDETVYTVLAQGENDVWSAVSVHMEMPTELGPNEVVIRGHKDSSWRGSIHYGIEQYFVPEEMRHKISDEIREERHRILIDVAVDPQGRASVLRLHVGDKTYEY